MNGRATSQRSSPALVTAAAVMLTTCAGKPRIGAACAIGVVLLAFQTGCAGSDKVPPSKVTASLLESESPVRPESSNAVAVPASATPNVRHSKTSIADAALTAPAPSAGGLAAETPFARVDLPELKGRVVRGSPDLARSVAVVDVARCFESIPSYRVLRGDRESRDYARYLLNLADANREFRDAVEWIAIHEGIDLVVEKKALPDRSVADITDLVCERIESPTNALTR
jgi:hypothetical protein